MESSPGGLAIRRHLDAVLLLGLVEQEAVQGPAPVSGHALAETIDVQAAYALVPADEPAAVEGDLCVLGEQVDDFFVNAPVEVPP